MDFERNIGVRFTASALLAVALGACSAHPQSGAQATAAPVSQPATAQPAAATAAPAAATFAPLGQAATPTAAPAAQDAGVASSDGEKTGTKLVVNSLTRAADTLTLKFTLINNAAVSLGMSGAFQGSGYHGTYRDVSGIDLIDIVSKKKYFPLADTDGNCICSRDMDDIPPNSQAPFWVKYPAPPASTTKISVQVPHFIPLDDVPITQ